MYKIWIREQRNWLTMSPNLCAKFLHVFLECRQTSGDSYRAIQEFHRRSKSLIGWLSWTSVSTPCDAIIAWAITHRIKNQYKKFTRCEAHDARNVLLLFSRERERGNSQLNLNSKLNFTKNLSFITKHVYGYL